VAAKEVRSAAKTTYLSGGPNGENLRELSKPLIFGLLWHTKRLGVSDMSKVLMQALRENVQILLSESLAPFVYEFDLWGIGAFFVGHLDGAAEGDRLGDLEASGTLRFQRYILYIHRHVRSHWLDRPMTTAN